VAWPASLSLARTGVPTFSPIVRRLRGQFSSIERARVASVKKGASFTSVTSTWTVPCAESPPPSVTRTRTL
jgi:hypothetical protein